MSIASLSQITAEIRRRVPFLIDVLHLLPGRLFLLARERRLRGKSMQEVFYEIHSRNLWGNLESCSGFNSSLEATEDLRAQLPRLIANLGVRTMLDIPCGDFNWMRATELKLESYIGADIIDQLVARNREMHERPGRRFTRIDIVADLLPRVDLVLCRDLFIHFPDDHVRRAVANIRASGSTFLLTTSFRRTRRNTNIPMGSFRPINLERPPFSWPAPECFVAEGREGRLFGRGLGLWRIADVPSPEDDAIGIGRNA